MSRDSALAAHVAAFFRDPGKYRSDLQKLNEESLVRLIQQCIDTPDTPDTPDRTAHELVVQCLAMDLHNSLNKSL